MDRILHVHWDQFVNGLKKCPDDPNQLTNYQAAQDLLIRIENQDFDGEYLWNLTDDVIGAAWRLLSNDDVCDPALEYAQFTVDEDRWPDLLHQLYRLKAMCDPSLSEVFL